MNTDTTTHWALMKAETTPRIAGTPGVSRMFFARAEIGSQHLSTGMTSFEPGTGLFWHIHPHDESVTVLRGEPDCEVGGAGKPIESHRLQPFDTTFIPAHTPHRFFNRSDGPVSILWSYPTARIERYPVNPDGSRPDDSRAGN